MKSQILIFTVCVYCLNLVSSYHQYLDYRNGAYPQRPDWSNNQDYSQNQNPAYSLHQPAADYGQLQQVVNYAQYPTEAKYAQPQPGNFPEQKQEQIYLKLQEISEQQRQQLVEESSAEIQSEAIYGEQLSSSLPQTYQEASSPYLDSPGRIYGVGPQIWQQAPSQNPVYRPESYPQQVSRQWPHRSHLTVTSIPQEPYSQPMAYWEPSGYQNVPSQKKYYGGSSYSDKPIYDTPVQVQRQAQAPTASANNFRELLASNPKVKEYMASQEKRFLLMHPNGMTEYVDVLDKSLLGNSRHFKSSDIFIEEDIPEKIMKKAHKNLDDYQIGSTAHTPDSHDENIHSNESLKNYLEPQRSNFSEEMKPDTVPVIENQSKKYSMPSFGQIQTYKETQNEGSSITPADQSIVYNNYGFNPVLKHPKQPYENFAREQNIESAPSSPMRNYDSWYVNPSQPQESETHIIEKSDDKEPLYEENNNIYHDQKYSYPVQTNSVSSSNLSSSKTVGDIIYNQDPTVTASPSNDQIDYYNPSGSSYLDTPSQAFYYGESYEDPNELDKTTITLPYYLQNLPKESDTNKTNQHPSFETSKNSDDDDRSFNNYKKKQKINDNSDSNVENVNSETSRNNVEVPTNYKENQDNFNFENTNLDEHNNYDIVNETKPNKSDIQNINYEFITNNDNQQSNVGSEYSDSDLSSTTADEITTLLPVEKESPYCEYCATADEDQTKFPTLPPGERGSPYCEYCANDEDQTEIDDNLPAQPEIIYLTEETDPNDTIDEHEVLVVDFTDLKNVNKPFFWFQLPENISDELSTESDLEETYFIELKFLNPVIERISKSVTQNGTTTEEIEETVWEHKDDTLPRQRRFTKIITYHGPDYERTQKTNTDETEDAVVPK